MPTFNEYPGALLPLTGAELVPLWQYGTVKAPVAQLGSRGLSASLAYSPASGSIDPGAGISGFASSVGRLNITLSGDTTFAGLPSGAVDGQQLVLAVVAGNYVLTLDAFGATVGAPFMASSSIELVAYDAILAYWDKGLEMWVL